MTTKAEAPDVPVRRKAVRKDALIPVRVTAAQKKVLTTAATKAGLGVSPWLLMLGLKAAREA